MRRVGYGTDGNIWGGEVLECDARGFKRVSHLEEQPMLGGDVAAIYPLRMLAGILVDRDTTSEIEPFLHEHADKLRQGAKTQEDDVALLLEIIRRGKSARTTSTGRVLDAVACALEVCFERTYEGEPAMRLEAVAVRGEDVPSSNRELWQEVFWTLRFCYRRFSLVVRNMPKPTWLTLLIHTSPGGLHSWR